MYLCPVMKQKEHLPFFGIGPYYVAAIAILTVVGILLSCKGYLDSGIIPALKMFICIGVSLFAGNLWLLVLPFIFWGLMALMMKLTEEKWLRDLYGAEYEAYCKRVNRTWPWFPKK